MTTVPVNHPFLGEMMISKKMELAIDIVNIAFINNKTEVNGEYCYKWLAQGEEVNTLSLYVPYINVFGKTLISLKYNFKKIGIHRFIVKKGLDSICVKLEHYKRSNSVINIDLLKLSFDGFKIMDVSNNSLYYESIPFFEVFQSAKNNKFSILKCLSQCKYCESNHSNEMLNTRVVDIIKQTYDLVKKKWIFEGKSDFLIDYNREICKDHECGCCLESFKDKDLLFKSTNCTHLYHIKCITDWGESERSQFTCPKCRAEVSIFPKCEYIPKKLSTVTNSEDIDLDSDDDMGMGLD